MRFSLIRVGLVLSLLTLSTDRLPAQEASPDASRAQTQVITIGILDFHDESSSNVARLSEQATQRLREKIVLASQDLLPRLLGADAGATVTTGRTPVELADLGRQMGVKLIVRGGILSITVETVNDGTRATVRLYADIVISETGVVDTVRVEGTDVQTGSFPDLSGSDAAAPEFGNAPVGRALTSAIERLTEVIREKALAAVSAVAPVDPTPVIEQAVPVETSSPEQAASPATVDVAAQAAEQDQELEQLIADAQSTLNAGLAVDPTMLNRVSQGLNDLQSSLAVKADLLQKGEATDQVEQEIGQHEAELRAAIDAVMQSPVVTESAGYPATEGSGQGGDPLATANNYASQAISLIQQIKELEALIGGANEEVQAENQEDYGGEYEDAYGQPAEQPSEEPVEEVTGVVVDDGQPVEGAEVTDTESGATGTTAPDGSYRLPIQPGIFSHILVKKNGQQVAASRVRVVPGRMNVLDFPLTKSRGVGPGVISSAASGRAGRGDGGMIKGRLRDPEGNPGARVLVALAGVGTVRSNSKGEFIFMNVPAGVHRLNVQRPGVEAQGLEVQVTPKSIALAEVNLSRYIRAGGAGLPIISAGSGTSVYGRIRDDQGKALVAARVILTRAGSSVSVRSSRQGAYELKNLSPGDYQIRVSRPGFQASGASLKLVANRKEKRDFRLKLASDLVARVRNVEASKQGFVRGKIKSTENRALAGATVELAPTGRQLGPYKTRTGANGEFKLTVREGQYHVRISQVSFRPTVRPVSVKAGKSVDADFTLSRITPMTPRPPVSGGSQTRTTLRSRDSSAIGSGVGSASTVDRDSANRKTIEPAAKPALLPGHVSGRVVDAKTGRPISGATVSVSGSGNAVTDGGGNYRISGIAAKSCVISVSRSGYAAQRSSVTVASGRTLTVNFSMTPVLRVPRAVIPKK